MSASASNGATSTSASSAASTGAGGGLVTKRPYPDTSSTISILCDQLPDLSAAQQQFVVNHYVGTEKLTLDQSMPLRALDPNFLVLHYHLAIWQSAPGVDFIVDGMTWGNDYPTVTMNESWFWHNEQNSRVQSVNDGKYLMNLYDPGFRAYWESSIEQQVMDGDYDGVMADSASPALLQSEAQMPPEPRLQGTGAKDTAIAEWGGQTYIEVWNDFMNEINLSMQSKGIPWIPNTSAFTTTWDNSNYDLTDGIFVEGFGDPSFAAADWIASTNTILHIANEGKIVILQNYLSGQDDLARRRYYLANYLLVKANKTYLDYFANGPLEWYPEWKLDLGAPVKTATTVDDLATNGVYRRDYANGAVLVNPTDNDVTVDLGATMQRVEPQGGGDVDAAGDEPGTLSSSAVTSIDVPAHGAEILTNM